MPSHGCSCLPYMAQFWPSCQARSARLTSSGSMQGDLLLRSREDACRMRCRRRWRRSASWYAVQDVAAGSIGGAASVREAVPCESGVNVGRPSVDGSGGDEVDKQDVRASLAFGMLVVLRATRAMTNGGGQRQGPMVVTNIAGARRLWAAPGSRARRTPGGKKAPAGEGDGDGRRRLRTEMADGDDRRRRPTGNDRPTAVTDGGGRRAAMMGGGDGLWSTEGADGSADERGRWATRRALRHTEETGGCGRRTRSCGYGQTEGRRMWPAAGGNRRMWPADIGCYDGWRAGGCGDDRRRGPTAMADGEGRRR